MSERSELLVSDIKLALEVELTSSIELPIRQWDIWVEGFAVTGNCSNASLLKRKTQAKSFREACLRYALEQLEKDSKWADYGFSIGHLSYWGCSWYADEATARKTFG